MRVQKRTWVINPFCHRFPFVLTRHKSTSWMIHAAHLSFSLKAHKKAQTLFFSILSFSFFYLFTLLLSFSTVHAIMEHQENYDPKHKASSITSTTSTNSNTSVPSFYSSGRESSVCDFDSPSLQEPPLPSTEGNRIDHTPVLTKHVMYLFYSFVFFVDHYRLSLWLISASQRKTI